MEQHKFKIGDHVSLNAGRHDLANGDGYEVTRLLPAVSPEPQYRIKRGIETYERVAGESLLRSVGLDRRVPPGPRRPPATAARLGSRGPYGL